MILPGLFRNGRYKVIALGGEVMGRCPWCNAIASQRQAAAEGVLGDGTVLPVRERLLLCADCGRAAIRPALLARLVGGAGTFALTLFMLPLFGGALYFTASFAVGLVRGAPFDPLLGGLCLGGLSFTGLGIWIPLRRFTEAVRPGAVRVELPVDIDLT
jgi:hypothetical protein